MDFYKSSPASSYHMVFNNEIRSLMKFWQGTDSYYQAFKNGHTTNSGISKQDMSEQYVAAKPHPVVEMMAFWRRSSQVGLSQRIPK
jgi:hypothetical protein